MQREGLNELEQCLLECLSILKSDYVFKTEREEIMKIHHLQAAISKLHSSSGGQLSDDVKSFCDVSTKISNQVRHLLYCRKTGDDGKLSKLMEEINESRSILLKEWKEISSRYHTHDPPSLPAALGPPPEPPTSVANEPPTGKASAPLKGLPESEQGSSHVLNSYPRYKERAEYTGAERHLSTSPAAPREYSASGGSKPVPVNNPIRNKYNIPPLRTALLDSGSPKSEDLHHQLSPRTIIPPLSPRAPGSSMVTVTPRAPTSPRGPLPTSPRTPVTIPLSTTLISTNPSPTNPISTNPNSNRTVGHTKIHTATRTISPRTSMTTITRSTITSSMSSVTPPTHATTAPPTHSTPAPLPIHAMTSPRRPSKLPTIPHNSSERELVSPDSRPTLKKLLSTIESGLSDFDNHFYNSYGDNESITPEYKNHLLMKLGGIGTSLILINEITQGSKDPITETMLSSYEEFKSYVLQYLSNTKVEPPLLESLTNLYNTFVEFQEACSHGTSETVEVYIKKIVEQFVPHYITIKKYIQTNSGVNDLITAIRNGSNLLKKLQILTNNELKSAEMMAAFQSLAKAVLKHAQINQNHDSSTVGKVTDEEPQENLTEMYNNFQNIFKDFVEDFKKSKELLAQLPVNNRDELITVDRKSLQISGSARQALSNRILSDSQVNTTPLDRTRETRPARSSVVNGGVSLKQKELEKRVEEIEQKLKVEENKAKLAEAALETAERKLLDLQLKKKKPRASKSSRRTYYPETPSETREFHSLPATPTASSSSEEEKVEDLSLKKTDGVELEMQSVAVSEDPSLKRRMPSEKEDSDSLLNNEVGKLIDAVQSNQVKDFDSQIQVILNQDEIPYIIRSFFSSITLETMKNILILYETKEYINQPPISPSSPPTNPMALLIALSHGHISSNDILKCNRELLRKLLPLVANFLRTRVSLGSTPTDFMSFGQERSTEEEKTERFKFMSSLMKILHEDQQLAQLFYWVGSNEKLFDKKRRAAMKGVLEKLPMGDEIEIDVFYKSPGMNNIIHFFEKLEANWKSIKVGHKEILQMFDPLQKKIKYVKQFKVLKIFDSKAKPLLVEFLYEDESSSKAILKLGDDLRQDLYTQSMFTVFNIIWASSPLPYKPFLYTYDVIPVTKTIGMIEFIPDVKSVNEYDWGELKKMGTKEKMNFLCSAAGSFIGSWVLGIRDRHQDNMLIKSKQTFFHIDFGHLFNNKPLVDAPRMSIPEGLQKNLSENEWNQFKELCCSGFGYLYKNGSLIRELCTMLFSGIYKRDWLEEFLGSDKSLMLTQSSIAANARIQRHIATGSSKWNVKKQFKYSTHNAKISTASGVFDLIEQIGQLPQKNNHEEIREASPIRKKRNSVKGSLADFKVISATTPSLTPPALSERQKSVSTDTITPAQRNSLPPNTPNSNQQPQTPRK